MSIVRLSRVTLLGHVDDKTQVLEELQTLGCMHLIPLAHDGAGGGHQGPSTQARDALKFLLTSPTKRRQVRDPAHFDAACVERDAIALEKRLQDLQDQRDFLAKRVSDLAAWGDFDLGSLADLGGLRLWFYLVPQYQMKKVEATDLRWEVVNRDNRFCYVVVIAPDEPDSMPVARTHTGDRPRHELEARLDEVELAIEDAVAERVSLTRWCTLFARSLDRLEDRAARAHAATWTCDVTPLFGVQGWVPRAAVAEVTRYATAHALVVEVTEPEPDERPPTLFHNAPAVCGGQDLVTFYMTPGYWTWDPSGVVLYSFALFFAMILADAGYAAILGLVLAVYAKRLGRSDAGRRFRTTFATVVGFSLVYGVLAGSYFSIELAADSPLLALKIVDVKDFGTMMTLSIIIGVAHVALGCIMDAVRRGPCAAAVPPLGWAVAVVGAFVYFQSLDTQATAAATAGSAMLVSGLGAVFLFSGSGGPGARLLGGLLALTRVSNAFGDVMSYLRLFALGLATASLAEAFNGMAMEIRAGVPGLGLLAALLVLLIGHTMNFVLGLMSAVVHGLRLNVIEFFNWGLQEEGTLFRPFHRKESTPWKPSS